MYILVCLLHMNFEIGCKVTKKCFVEKTILLKKCLLYTTLYCQTALKCTFISHFQHFKTTQRRRRTQHNTVA